MTQSTLKFKINQKDQLYYDRYEYCFGFELQEASALRGLTHTGIDQLLDQRIEWRKIAQNRWPKNSTFVPNHITDQVRQNLHEVCDVLTDADCKLVVSTHHGWIYTNDLDLIDQLRGMRCLSQKTYTRAVINRARNTIIIKKSTHQQRSYFHSIKLSPQEKLTLENFFRNQQQHIRTSPAFTHWLFSGSFLRLQDYFFIDYSGEQWMTMLSLIRPGLIRKTQTIVTK